jgi:hypothetical protein
MRPTWEEGEMQTQALTILAVALLMIGCAGPTLTPWQERVYAAFADCKERTSANARLAWVDASGQASIESTSTGLDVVRLRQCLRERYGFVFGGDPGYRAPTW